MLYFDLCIFLGKILNMFKEKGDFCLIFYGIYNLRLLCFWFFGFDFDVDKISYVVLWCVVFIIIKYFVENILMVN